MATHSFVRALSALSFESCFNPYSDRCKVHDVPDAPQRRSALLSAMISRAQSQDVDAIWIGRDLGYRGGRRTGLALTDDIHVSCHADRWGISADRPTIGSAVSERTAAVIWSMLERIDAGIFLWNVFPLHPHDAGNPFTNRPHNVRERRAGEEILGRLIQLLKPRRIVAIGNDAAMAVARLEPSVPIESVRHPSYGGQRQFVDQISKLYSIAPAQEVGLF